MSCWRSSFVFFALLAFLAEANLAQVSAQPKSRLKSSPGLAATELGFWKSIPKGMDFRNVTLERNEPYQLIHLKIFRFDASWFVPKILRSPQYNVKSTNVKTFAEKSGAVATINANYFDEQRRPLGFLKAQPHENNANISKSSLFTGVFGIKDRSPFIVHRDDFSPNQADEALQAGPLLLSKGAVLAVSRGAGKQSRRALIGLDRERRLILAITDSLLGGLSWEELQEFFLSSNWQVNATDLLNLDGGGSAQLYVRVNQFEEYVPGTTDVPVAIGFFQK
jgi:uncharacterized protein YigE (DUF2233 family)